MPIDLSWLDDDSCAEVLRRYFSDLDGVPAYSGSRFEVFGDNPPYRIVVDDLIAVSMLSVAIPPHAVLRILERDAGAIAALLAHVPPDRDLHEVDSATIDHASAAEQLWKVLRDGVGQPRRIGMGDVRVSKLLARKRPRLLPVYDRHVANGLELPNSDEHWLELHRSLQSTPHHVDALRKLRQAAHVPSAVSLLRVLDVLLWMRGRTEADDRAERGLAAVETGGDPHPS